MKQSSQRPVIYQVLPRLYGNLNAHCVPNGTLADNGAGHMDFFTDERLRQIGDMGFTHIWYTGIIEHAHTPDYTSYGIPRHHPAVVKGQAGSPYAITDYYSVDPDIATHPEARMEEFEALIERTHAAALKAIIDFVPNHVSRLYHSTRTPKGVKDLGSDDDNTVFFSPNNNFLYLPGQTLDIRGVNQMGYEEMPARATGNDCYTAHPGTYDWYETVKLNYGRNPLDGRPYWQPVPDTWHKMRDIVLYWAGKGVDGMRCDMVHMVPLEFWAWLIPQVKARHPQFIFIGELYEIALYRPYVDFGGFDYLYDKVGLYDTLRGIQCHGWSADSLTHTWQRTDGLGHHLLTFLENHDEQRYASAQYAGDPNKVWPSLAVTATINRGAVMIYAGQELGEKGGDAEGYSGKDGRTSIFDYWSIPALRDYFNGERTPEQMALRADYSALLRLVNKEDALREGAFYDLMYANYGNAEWNAQHQWAYLRHTYNKIVLVAVNFDSHDITMAINIPPEAFLAAGLHEGSRYKIHHLWRQVADVGSENGPVFSLSSSEPLKVDIKAQDAVIISLVRQ